VPNIREFEPILPDPQPYVEKALELYDSCLHRNRGKVVFIEAELGGGKTELLGAIGKALHHAKPTPNFVAGYFSRGEFKPYSLHWREPICLRRAIIAAGSIVSLLGFLPVQYAFASSLIGQAIQTWFGAQELAGDFTKEPHAREQHAEHLKTKLRRAAEESPTIVLLDDWDESQRCHWDSMLLSFAREIAQSLPILIFLTVKAPINLDAPEKDGPSEVIKSLTEKGLAEVWTLESLSVEDVAAAIGPTVPSIARMLHRATGGNARWVREVWREWRLNETVVVNDGDRWLWNPQRPGTVNLYADILEDRLKRILGDRSVMEIEQVREVLACAALEGPQFTADAVALALGWDRDELVDLLDDLVQSDKNSDGVLVDEGFVSIPTANGPARTLWRYSFVSDLHWFALDRFGFANERRTDDRDTERNQKSVALIGGLLETYQTEERLVAAPLARLLRGVGHSAAALRYQEMADHTVRHEMMREQALNLVSINKEQWEPWQCERASRFLIAAGLSMSSTFPNDETFLVRDEAAKLASYAKNQELEAEAHCLCSQVLLSAGKYDEAKLRTETALAIFLKIGDRTGEARCHNLLSVIADNEGRYDNARKHASLSLAINESTGNRIGKANSLSRLARIDSLEGCYEAARERLCQSQTIYVDENDLLGEAFTLGLLAAIDRIEGKYDDARKRTLRKLMIHQDDGDRPSEANTLFQLAQIDHLQGNYHCARELVTMSLRIDEEIGQIMGEVAASCLLADLELVEAKYDEARGRLMRSLAICQEIGQRQFEACSLYLLAMLDSEQGWYSNARERASQSLGICMEIGYTLFEAVSIEVLAGIDREEGKYVDAKERAAIASKIYRNLGERLGEATTLQLLARIYRDEGKYVEARERAGLSLAICTEIENPRRQADALDLLSQIDRDEGKSVDARKRASQSLSIRHAIGIRAGEAASLNLLAQIDLDEGKCVDARDRASQSLAIRQEIGSPAGEAASLNLLAQIDRDEGKYVDARKRASLSLGIRQQIGEPAGEATSLSLLARIDCDEGKVGDARERAVRALAIAQEIGHRKQETISLQLLTEIDKYETR
jgi:tetratricopeptide (TPR) repeat protein